MKRWIVVCTFFLLPSLAPSARAALVTLSYSGTIDAVLDAGASGTPPINFPPVPDGSEFSGTITYESTSPQTGGGTGYAFYYDLAPYGSSLTVNGLDFPISQPGYGNPGMHVVSQEAGFGFSGVTIDVQPISLPAGWQVDVSYLPAIELGFEDVPGLTRSLALPTTVADFPTASDTLVIDFQQQVTVDGITYGGVPYITGTITSFSVVVPEPSSLTLAIIGLVVVMSSSRARTSSKAELGQSIRR